MKTLTHYSAKPSHYNKEALHYDAFLASNEENVVIDQFIETIFEQYRVKTVLDLTCGTSSQVFWLIKRGYVVVGVEILKKPCKIYMKTLYSI